MLRLMVTTGCRLFVGIGISAGREGATRGAEGRREKAKNDQQRTDAREETVFSGAHTFIVRGVGWEGIVFWNEEVLGDTVGIRALCIPPKRSLAKADLGMSAAPPALRQS